MFFIYKKSYFIVAIIGLLIGISLIARTVYIANTNQRNDTQAQEPSKGNAANSGRTLALVDIPDEGGDIEVPDPSPIPNTITIAYDTVKPFVMYHNQTVNNPGLDVINLWAQWGLIHLNTKDTVLSIDQIKSINPQAWILNYRQSNGIAAQTGAGGVTHPWGEKVRPDSIPEWIESNQYEDMFLHTNDPSNLIVNKNRNTYTISWAKDKRSSLNIIDLAGYNLYTGNSAIQNKKIAFIAASQPLTYIYSGTPDETHFRITSVLNNTQQSELSYSNIQTFDPRQKYLARVDFSTECVNPKPWPNYDCFHAYPGIDLRYNFTVELADISDFQLQEVAVFYSNARNGSFYYNPTTKVGNKLVLNRVANNTYTGSITNINASDISGSPSYFINIQGIRSDGTLYSRQYPNNNYTLTTSVNNRVRYMQHGTYVANILNPFWTTFSIDQINKMKQRFGFTGVYIDLSWLSVTAGHGHYDARGYNVPPRSDQASIDLYQKNEYQAKLRHYEAIKAADNHIILNRPDLQVVFNDGQDDLINKADGGKIESFVLSMTRGAKDYDGWLADMEIYLHWQDKNKIAEIQPKFPLNGYQSPPYPTTSENDRWYAYTSYLLGKKNATARSYYNIFPFGLSRAISEYSVSLGAPNENEYINLKNAIARKDPWFKRGYEKGIVIVNPSNTPLLLSQLGLTLPNGSKVARLDETGMNQTVQYQDATMQTEIPAKSGRIIIYGTLEPTVTATPTLTPTPTSTPIPTNTPTRTPTPTRIATATPTLTPTPSASSVIRVKDTTVQNNLITNNYNSNFSCEFGKWCKWQRNTWSTNTVNTTGGLQVSVDTRTGDFGSCWIQWLQGAKADGSRYRIKATFTSNFPNANSFIQLQTYSKENYLRPALSTTGRNSINETVTITDSNPNFVALKFCSWGTKTSRTSHNAVLNSVSVEKLP